MSVTNNLVALCDEVILGVDPNFEDDFNCFCGLCTPNPKVEIVHSKWQRTHENKGLEIAHQMDLLVTKAKNKGADWVVVLQADEFLHEKDFELIRSFCNYFQNSEVDGFSMDRLYFWKDLKTLRKDWEFPLVRIFKPGHYSFLAEDTDQAGMFSGRLKPGHSVTLPCKIYHYSRVGNPSNISKRVRNLDTFFHEEKVLVPEKELLDYDFKTRQYDNYNVVEKPPEVEGVFEEFEGTHPRDVLGLYENC